MKEKAKMFGNGDYQFEVSICKVCVTDEKGERQTDDEVFFTVYNDDRVLRKDHQTLGITMSKGEAIEFANYLLEQANSIQVGNE